MGEALILGRYDTSHTQLAGGTMKNSVPTKIDEIEITPKMIKAGVDVSGYDAGWYGDWADIEVAENHVRRIYKAMVIARLDGERELLES